MVGDPARANELLAVAEAGLRAEKRVGLLPQLRSVRIPVSLVLGDLATAAEAAADTQRLAPRTHQPIWTVSSRVGAAMTAALRGDAEEAADLAAAAERQIRHRGIPALLAFVHLAAGGRC